MFIWGVRSALPVNWQALVGKGPTDKEDSQAGAPQPLNGTSNGGSCRGLDLSTPVSSQFPN
jgi:hypothetical protein